MPAHNTTGFTASTGSIAMVAGNAYPIALTNGTFFGGPASIEGQVGSTVLKGIYQLVGALGTFSLFDTSSPEFHLQFGNFFGARLAAFPYAPYTLQFFCTASATAPAIFSAIPNY